MSHSCPECGCRAAMRDSRPTSTGRRRRFHCTSTLCGHRWNEWEGGRPQLRAPQPTAAERRILAAREPRLTEAQVRLILSRRDISSRQLAKLVGISRQAICNVRLGRSYRTVAPDLERWLAQRGARTCLVCVEWIDGCCRQGWPDPIEEGPGFAAWCDDFQLKC
jgi:hypothetical protein